MASPRESAEPFRPLGHVLMVNDQWRIPVARDRVLPLGIGDDRSSSTFPVAADVERHRIGTTEVDGELPAEFVVVDDEADLPDLVLIGVEAGCLAVHETRFSHRLLRSDGAAHGSSRTW
jgi:hypothetical protein